MGSVDLPPFLREKMKEKINTGATNVAPVPATSLPPFIKKKDGGVGYGLPSDQSQSNSSLESSSVQIQPAVVTPEDINVSYQNLQNKKLNTQDVNNLATTEYGKQFGMDKWDNSTKQSFALSINNSGQKQAVSTNAKQITTKYFQDIIPSLVQNNQNPKSVIEGFDNGNPADAKIMRDQITSLLEKKKTVINSAAYDNTFKNVPLYAPIPIQQAAKTPEQQAQLSDLDNQLKAVNDTFNKYIGNSLVNKYVKLAGGKIRNVDNASLGKDYNSFVNNEDQTKAADLVLKSDRKDIEAQVAKQNLKYKDEKSGLDLLINSVQNDYYDHVADGYKNNDDIQLQQAATKAEQLSDLSNQSNNLLDKYPSVAYNYVSKVLSDNMAGHSSYWNQWNSQDDVKEAAQRLNEKNPDFINKWGKYINIFEENPSLLQKRGLPGALARGGYEAVQGLIDIGSTDENRAIRATEDANLPILESTSRGGANISKIVLADNGNAFIEKPNTNYGKLNLNTAPRIVGEALPGFGEWMLAEAATGGLASGLIGDIKAAKYIKAVSVGGDISKVAALEDITASAALKRTASLIGAQYAVSFNNNYDFANELVKGDTPQDNFKKKVIANITTLGQAATFKLLDISPSSLLGKSFSNDIAKDAYSFVESNEGKITEKNLYQFFQDKVVPSAKGIAESAKMGVKFGGVGVINKAFEDIVGNIFSDKYKGGTAEDYGRIFTEQALVGMLTSLPSNMVNGFHETNKDALYNAGLYKDEITQQINNNVTSGLLEQEKANGMISIAKTMNEEIENAFKIKNEHGLPLDNDVAKNIAVLNFRKRYLEEYKPEGSEAAISNIDKDINTLLTKENYFKVDDSPFIKGMGITDTDGNEITTIKDLSPKQKYTFFDENSKQKTLGGAKIIKYIDDNFKPDEEAIASFHDQVAALQEKQLHQHGFDTNANIVKVKEGEPLTPEEQQQLDNLNKNILSHQNLNQNGEKTSVQESKTGNEKINAEVNAQKVNEKNDGQGHGQNVTNTEGAGTKTVSSVEEVHKAAKDANIDINTDEFKAKSKELTGENHLDNMTPEQLGRVKNYIDETKAQTQEPNKQGVEGSQPNNEPISTEAQVNTDATVNQNIKPAETTGSEVVPSIESKDLEKNFDAFKDEAISMIETIKDTSYDFGITIRDMSREQKEGAIKDIREGKDTPRANKLLAHLKDMHDSGMVTINRGRGNHAVTHDVPINEWFSLSSKEQNSVEKFPDDLTELINKEGITVNNIDNLKHLFNGFIYDEKDFQQVKDYLSKQSESNGNTKPISEESQNSNNKTINKEVFEALDKADKKRSDTGKQKALSKIESDFGELGKKAKFIHDNFDEILKQLNIERKC